MRSLRKRSAILLAVLSLLAVTSPVAGAQTGAAAPRDPERCAGRSVPPPPVDTSEVPKPGQPAPRPLPVPDEPVGGQRMGECGLVLPKGASGPPSTINSASWVLHDLDTGDVLAAKDPHARQRPASLIKVLLALVVIEELDGARMVTVTKEDAEQECTCVGLVAGGQYTINQLTTGLLMHSGNDTAHALATVLGGVPVAVEKMNSAAARLGATDTRTATPSGLDGPGMSSSTYDMSLIFHYAMKQPEFAKAVGTRQMQFPGWGDKPAFPLYNDNRLLSAYPGFLGGKTGFTDDARHTYLGAAERGGKRLAVVTMRGEQQPMRVSEQAAKLLDYGFSLASTKPAPVGQIFYSASALRPGGDADAQPGPNLDGDPATAASATGDDPFGTTGWIITLVVALLIIGGFVYGHQRKRAQPPAEY